MILSTMENVCGGPVTSSVFDFCSATTVIFFNVAIGSPERLALLPERRSAKLKRD
jgi:hypothetical protein